MRNEVLVSQMVDAVKEIIDLHQKTPSGDRCGECYVPWPCSTISVLKKHFEG